VLHHDFIGALGGWIDAFVSRAGRGGGHGGISRFKPLQAREILTPG
jgi:hypothetical protein